MAKTQPKGRDAFHCVPEIKVEKVGRSGMRPYQKICASREDV